VGVFKRGEYWWVDYRYNGRRIRESTGLTSKKRAEQLLAKRKAEVFEGRFTLSGVKPGPLFSQFADHYLENYSAHNKKLQSHRRDAVIAEHLKSFFGAKRLNAITPMLVDHYKNNRSKAGAAHATVNRELACMKHMYTIAMRDKLATSNPVKAVRFFRVDNEVTNVLSPKDERLLLREAAPHLQRIIICGLDTGLRLGEILSLKWKHVDVGRGIIRAEKTKSGKTREIPITQRLRKLLKKGNGEYEEHVFPGPRGNGLTTVRTAMKAALRRAGLVEKNYRFHDLRHTFATRLIENGVDPFTVQELLGHAAITTTQRYAHPGRQSKIEAIRKLSAGSV
jgi:integrase